MYKLFIIFALLAIPSIVIPPFIDIPDGIYVTFSLALQLGMMIFTGWQGNRLYYKQAVRVFRKGEDASDHEKAYFLQSKGGVSIAWYDWFTDYSRDCVWISCVRAVLFYQLSRILKTLFVQVAKGLL